MPIIINCLYLKGYLSFLLSVEPTYIIILKNKYGDRLIDELLINRCKIKDFAFKWKSVQ